MVVSDESSRVDLVVLAGTLARYVVEEEGFCRRATTDVAEADEEDTYGTPLVLWAGYRGHSLFDAESPEGDLLRSVYKGIGDEAETGADSPRRQEDLLGDGVVADIVEVTADDLLSI